MTRPVVRWFMAVLSSPAFVILTLGLSMAASGCSESDPFFVRHCKLNDSPRVSVNRVVTLYAHNYVYVSTRDTAEIRNSYINHALDIVEAAYVVANRILAADGINMQIFSLSVDGRVNERLDVFRAAGLGGTASVEDIDEMVRVHQGFSQVIGVHWPEWDRGIGLNNTEGQAPLSGGLCRDDRCNWVLMAGFIRNPVTADALGRILAHELGHYFNLDHVTNPPDNLMVEGGSGTVLNTSQRDNMWTSINTSPARTTLFSVTCDPPMVVAPRRPQFSSVPEPSTPVTAGEPSIRK